MDASDAFLVCKGKEEGRREGEEDGGPAWEGGKEELKPDL